MMSTIYSDGDLRFFRLAKGLVDHSTVALRKVFIQEWNSLYQSTPWQNNSTSGSQLLAEERAESRLYDPAYRRDYQHIKDNLSCGNVEEWDVTTLVFALKYSDALTQSRSSRRGRRILSAVHQLKEVRNSLIAHAWKSAISQSKFKRNIDILSQAVGVLVTNSDPLVEKLQTLKNETEFLTGDIVKYKQWLNDDYKNLLLLENDLERFEEKIKISDPKNGSSTPAVDAEAGSFEIESTSNSEIISRLRTRVAKLERQVTSVDLIPSRSKPSIFHSERYIKMMNNAYFLKFNFRWKDLEKFLQEFTCGSDVDIKLFAGILQANCHSHSSRSKKKNEFQALTDLIPNILMANNGYVKHGFVTCN